MIAVSIAIPDEAAFQVAILDMRLTNFPETGQKTQSSANSHLPLTTSSPSTGGSSLS